MAIALANPAFAQSSGAEGSQTEQSSDDPDGDGKDANGNDVIVVGIRGSLASAAAKKRKSKQIVDSVVAEDVGKLPDNNVPEALARVTGVQIDRVHGEGSGVSIRGMTDIQTTVNGFDNAVGAGRTASLADIPAELVKQIDVYKTRTPDQVEGGIAGTVNIELRRPLDLAKGLTVAGSFKEVFSSIGNTKSPYASLLVGERFDTGIGEMGFLINAGYTKNNYNEDFVESESPGTFFGFDANSIPADKRATTIAPYAVNYGVEAGSIERPSINVSTQWRPSDQLEFVLEGSYFASDEKRARDRLHLTVRQGTYNLSDLTYQPDGQSVKTVTVSPYVFPNGIVIAPINGGPESYYEKVHSDNFHTNFETRWHDDRTTINASAQYDWSKARNYFVLTTMRFKNLQSATVDFDSNKVPGGGPFITFNGVDLGDPAAYTIQNFHDQLENAKSNQFASQVDLTHRTSDTGLLRSFQIGARYSLRNTHRIYGYRDSFPLNAAFQSPTFGEFPGAGQYVSTTPDVPGFDAPTWFHPSGPALFDNLGAIRAYLTQRAFCCKTSVAESQQQWATEFPALERNGQGAAYDSRENSFAAYAQLNYGLKVAGVPIDGIAGVRVVNTWGEINSTASFQTIEPAPVYTKYTYTETNGRGNYLDILPSVTAVSHFTDKLQLRLSFSTNVTRPDFLQLSPFATYSQYDPSRIYTGNPDLKANRENSYDASLEYYFGRAGQLSANYYLKKPSGFLFYYCDDNQDYPPLGLKNVTVCTTQNAGPGTFEGVELAAQSFFDFLPGFWHNFGASANLTYLAKARIDYPDDSNNDAIGTSKYTYNLALYYDTPVFSARVAYNYRSRYRLSVQSDFPEYSLYNDPTSRLDAAVNFTPVKFLTLSVEAANLLKKSNRVYWGRDRLLPQGLRVQARTIQASARFRF